MKKIINTAEAFVDEVVDGILLAHADQLRAVDDARRVLVRADAGRQGTVGIVTGGGSGHLPLFLGYVGRGLASGVAIGNVFSSPSAEQVLDATLASDGGAGVLYLYGNYGGDVYNFDLAAQLAAGHGVRTATVLGTDDVVSAPPERAHTRRGVAGLFLAFKTAGAAARRGDDLETVAAVARRTVDRTRTMGVGLSPTILPAAGAATFSLQEGEMEVGIGIHGEPGQHRGPLETADRITDRFLEEILRELPVADGDRVVVLVNGMGATPLEELYLVYRRVHQVLSQRGVVVHRRYVGEYATSLEMAGASVSLLHLDDELADLVDASAESPFFQQGALPEDAPVPATPTGSRPRARAGREGVRRLEGAEALREVVLAVSLRMPRYADELREQDAAVGDGDLGITVSHGAAGVRTAVADLPDDAHPREVLRTAGTAFAGANPSTFAALVGGGLIAAGDAVDDATAVDLATVRTAVRALFDHIQVRGGAAVGDKTLLDVVAPVLELLDTAEGTATPDAVDLARRCAAESLRARDAAAAGRHVHGRAGWVGDRSAGHVDPGSTAIVRVIEEVALALAAPAT